MVQKGFEEDNSTFSGKSGSFLKKEFG